MEIADFTLTDQNGDKVSLSDFRGKPVFLFFGYTHCPDICPTTLAVLAQALRLLESDPVVAAELQGLFVSVDPARDTPESLKDYVAFFGERVVGVTGSAEQLGAFARQFGAMYAIDAPQPGKAADDYLVSHNATIFLVDPRARLHGRFPPPHEPRAIAEVFLRIRDFDHERSRRQWSIL
jgi:protein SCO1/2